MIPSLFRRAARLSILAAVCLLFSVCHAPQTQNSVAREWDEAILSAIRIDTPRPPVHARNLWHLSVAMYDAWAVYDATAKGYLTTEKAKGLTPDEIAKARDEAISYAAYGVIKNRYALSVNASVSLPTFDNLMKTQGYDPSVTT